MAEPTLALNFLDYQIRVAEFLGIAYYGAAGGEVAQAQTSTTNAHNADRVKRIINDGWRSFYNAHARWNWVLREFSITLQTATTGPGLVNSETWRYYMPDGFYGDLVGKITYPANSQSGVFLRGGDVQEILELRTSSSVTGYPTIYALRPLADDPYRRWELLLWPNPFSGDVLTGRARLYPNKLIEDTDVPNAGAQFDQAILAFCKAEAEQQVEDNSGVMRQAADAALVAAIRLDDRAAPSSVGYNDDRSDGIKPTRHAYTGVDTYTDGTGTVHTFDL